MLYYVFESLLIEINKIIIEAKKLSILQYFLKKRTENKKLIEFDY